VVDAVSARQLGVALCHDCHMLVALADHGRGQVTCCPRCGARVFARKPNSIMRTWALLLASIILYLPANLLPITISSSLGQSQSDTIISGVIYFLKSGSIAVGLIIFVASIFVPMLKILTLAYLLLSVQLKSLWRPRERTKLYRLVEAIGRWSMLDIYVVTIMVALVKLGALANVEAGPAAIYFASVVVLTMLAAETFDPRLMWDVIEETHEQSTT